MLVERGLLDYEMRVADVWPEFAVAGKGGVTLRHVLLHTAGVPGLPAETTPADLSDWDLMCGELAAQLPWWEPGTRFGYHVWTFGFLLGETVRRATGQTISALLRELITEPLGVEDEVHFGVPPRLLGRVARQVPPPGPAGVMRARPGSPADRADPPGVQPSVSYVNDPGFLASDIPSCGTMSARGVARVYAALLGHGSGGQLVAPARLRQLAAVAFTGQDEVMGIPTAWAFGYCPDRPGIGRPAAARRSG
jgi:CubicO group peptidase (beta-lactamase class C family)